MAPDPSPGPNPTTRPTPAPGSGAADVSDSTLVRTSQRTPGAGTPSPPGVPHIPGYEIIRLIARGGMGEVYAARDLTLDREVAIKTLLPGADPVRFVTEAKITARLSHPGIPPVHSLGDLPDGGHYLAMKLIPGGDLAQLLKGRASPAQGLPRFVQVFEQIAQAVGFAHSCGVLHRDLKPPNVMVGEFGEVQVMDWGLAKDRAAPGRAPGGDRADDGDLDSTHDGTIMGTPGYMAPEQARGEAVDARADVFALGAVLAVILTGQPAFVGTTGRQTIARAAAADLADALARLDACGADAELVALARRCLAANPADRPDDARAVTAEVAGYRAGVEARLRQAETDRARSEARAAEQGKRRRVVRWAGGLLAAALLAGFVGTTIGFVRADRRRADAERAEQRERERADGEAQQKKRADGEAKEKDEQRVRAEDREVRANKAYTKTAAVLDAMVSGAAGDSLATQAAVTAEQRKFLTEVLGYYEEFAAAAGTDEQTRTRTANAAFRIGTIQARLGQKDASAAAFVQARDRFARLAAEFPAVSEYRTRLAKSHNNLGLLLADLGRWAEAWDECRAGLTVRQKLAAEFPAVPRYRADLAAGHNSLGLVLNVLGKRPEAEGEYRKALAIFSELAAEFSAVSEYRAGMAHSHSNLGKLLADLGRWAEAEGEHRAGLTVRQKLAAEFPAVLQYRIDSAASHTDLGMALADLGKWVEAEDMMRTGLTVRQKLATEFPAVPQYRADLATSHTALGLLYNEQGRYEKSIEQSRFSLQADPGHAPTYMLLGLSLQQTGDIPGARAALTEAARLDPKWKGLLAQLPPLPVAPPPRRKM